MKIIPHLSLKDYTTFHVGGSAEYGLFVTTTQDIEEAVVYAREKKLPLFIMGKGSNLLISDEPFHACVLIFENKTYVPTRHSDPLSHMEDGRKASHAIHMDSPVIGNDDMIYMTAPAGMQWDDFVSYTVSTNLSGIECLSGIPGSVGAAPVQNIGAYGQECQDTFVSLKAYDTEKMAWVTLDKEACHFTYRDSLFKHIPGRYIITEVTFRLSPHAPTYPSYQSLQSYFQKHTMTHPTLDEIRAAVLAIRKEKLPDPTLLGNAGSFFTNPLIPKERYDALIKKYPGMPAIELSDGSVKLFAGWLIEQAGWKGIQKGNVGVYDLNALVITNTTGQATATEIKNLAEEITSDVQHMFGIVLKPEVQYVHR